MLQLNAGTKYYLYQQPVDMRKGSYGLCGVVNNEMRHNILLRDVFVFLNKKRSTIRLLQWDGDGFSLYEKKLAKGTFERKHEGDNGVVLLTHYQLQCILQGIILESIRFKRRYCR